MLLRSFFVATLTLLLRLRLAACLAVTPLQQIKYVKIDGRMMPENSKRPGASNPFSLKKNLRKPPWNPIRQWTDQDEELSKVLIYEGNMMVNCKGQVFKDGEEVDAPYVGLAFVRGSCDHPKWHRGPLDASPGGPLDTIVALTQPQWGAYYHLVVDSLSRLSWVHEQYPEVIQDPKTFFHLGYTNEIGQSWARLMGIKTEIGQGIGGQGGNQLLEGSWKAKKVLWPPSNYGAMYDGVDPHAVQFMRKYVETNTFGREPLMLAREETKTVLLMHRDRRAGKARSVLNPKQVLAAVKKEFPNWNVEVFSDFPTVSTPNIVEICKMFHRADLIVGPHGAGFSNLMCAKAGVPIIEYQQYYHAHDFQFLAVKLGNPYIGIRTDIDHGSTINVNITDLSTALQYGQRILQKGPKNARLEELYLCDKSVRKNARHNKPFADHGICASEF